MGAFFESALLFSLAVLIVLIGLLIYYFKGRITDLEQKNMKCLELIGDVYKSHLELKRGISIPFIREQVGGVQQTLSEQVGGMQQTTDPRIKIELQEQSQDDDFYEDEDDEDEDESDSDSDDEDSIVEIIDNQIKTVNVDLSGSIELSEEIDVEDMEIEDVDAISNDEVIKVEQSEPIIVNKVEIDGEIELDVEGEHAVDQSKRDSYKKMSLPALRGFIISNGYQTDNAKLQKMKKNELIDLIIESQ
jgi:hypothetical protein